MVNKLMVLGLDGMTFKLLDPLMDMGVMPNVKKLVENGVHGTLKTVFPPNTPAAWTSFQTGSPPSKHGIYDFMVYRKDLRNTKVVDSKIIKLKTFYEILDKKYKCVLINLPLSEPPKIKGIIIPSFLSKTNNKIYPNELEKKYDFKNFEVFISHFKRATNICKYSMRFLKKREKVLKQIFLNEDWDFYFELFSPTDWMQHLFFHNILENKDALKVYKKIDDIVGFYIKNAPKNTNIILMSDHGFATYKKVLYLNEWLKKEGYLSETKRKTRSDFRSDGTILNFISKISVLRKLVLFALEKFGKIIPFTPEVKLRIESQLGRDIDIYNSKAFCPSTGVCGIYINDKRFTGKVKSKNKEKIIKELIDKLKKTSFFEKVTRNKNAAKYAPDILLETYTYRIYDNLTGKIIGNTPINYHDKDGIFIASGPSIGKKSKRLTVSILDIMPTILHLFKIKIPNNVKGKTLKYILKKGLRK